MVDRGFELKGAYRKVLVKPADLEFRELWLSDIESDEF